MSPATGIYTICNYKKKNYLFKKKNQYGNQHRPRHTYRKLHNQLTNVTILMCNTLSTLTYNIYSLRLERRARVMGPFKCYVTLFFWKLDHPPPRNANNIEPYGLRNAFFPENWTPHPHLRYVTLDWPPMHLGLFVSM